MNVTDTRSTILAAAGRLLAAGGADALRVRDIAAEANCSTMGVYSHFGGKDGVVEAIYIDGFQRFAAALQLADRTDDDHTGSDAADDRGGGLTLAMGRAYRRWAHDNPGPYQLMFAKAVPGFVPSPEAEEVAIRAFQVLSDAVAEDQERGRLADDEPSEVAWALWGMCHGLVMLELVGMTAPTTRSDADSVYESAIQAALRGYRR